MVCAGKLHVVHLWKLEGQEMLILQKGLEEEEVIDGK
jgi:hypothetical protein